MSRGPKHHKAVRILQAGCKAHGMGNFQKALLGPYFRGSVYVA